MTTQTGRDGSLIWYVVHTVPRYERAVDRNLNRQGYETFYPHYHARVKRWVPSRRCRRVETIERACFHRYLFVGLRQGQGLYTVNETPYVSTVVHNGKEPLEVPQDVMADLMTRYYADVDETKRDPRKRYPRGQRVRFLDNNPFSGLNGEISIDEGNIVRVLLDCFGGEREVTVHPEAVAEIA